MPPMTTKIIQKTRSIGTKILKPAKIDFEQRITDWRYYSLFKLFSFISICRFLFLFRDFGDFRVRRLEDFLGDCRVKEMPFENPLMQGLACLLLHCEATTLFELLQSWLRSLRRGRWSCHKTWSRTFFFYILICFYISLVWRLHVLSLTFYKFS